jgi:hypothetical protein
MEDGERGTGPDKLLSEVPITWGILQLSRRPLIQHQVAYPTRHPHEQPVRGAKVPLRFP